MGQLVTMKKLNVEVCVCTECVMKGAMDLIESIESLKKLKVQLRFNTQIQIEMNKCLGEAKHGLQSPLVKINDELVEKADSETVMAKIIALASQDIKSI